MEMLINNTRYEWLVTTTALNTKISEFENKIRILEFNKLTAENFSARLKQAKLVTKTNFDKKKTSFNRKITSKKTKYLEAQKKLNSLITNDYNFFFDRLYFVDCTDGSQNTFVYQPTLNTLISSKVLIIFLVGNQMEHIIVNLSHYLLLSYMA